MSSSSPDEEKKVGFFSKLFKKTPKKEKPRRAHTWPVPYVSKLEGAILTPGQSVVIRGYVTGEKRFDINLSSGPRVEGDNMDNVILHVSNRLDDKKVILNTCKDNEWGEEKKLKCPFKEGEEFDMRIRAHPDKFEIFANHKEIGLFDYRLPISTITHIHVDGDVELYTVSWEGKYYSVPYEAGIPGNFTPGRKLFVSGEWEKTAKEMKVSLFSGNDVAFHFNPRFSEKAIVRNSRTDGKWMNEEREGEFTFSKKLSFDVTIVCEEGSFQCYVDGEKVCAFAHRMSPHNIDKLEISGDVELQGVHLK